jgi:hypothetical protein
MTTKKRVRCTVRATTSSAQHLRLRRVPPRRRKAFPATGAAIYQGSPRLSARRSSNRNVPLASPCLRRATPFTFQTPFVDRPLAVVPQIPIKFSLASAANAAELASIAARPIAPNNCSWVSFKGCDDVHRRTRAFPCKGRWRFFRCLSGRMVSHLGHRQKSEVIQLN